MEEVHEKLHELGWINKHKPFWWNVDYAIDPREKVSLEQFKERLVTFPWFLDTGEKEARWNQTLYKGERVPILLLDANVGGLEMTLFVTARPYNFAELRTASKNLADPTLEELEGIRKSMMKYNYSDDAIEQWINREIDKAVYWPLERLMKDAQKGNAFPLLAHFHPHVRGITKVVRNNTLFWYPLLSPDAEEPVALAAREKVPELNIWTHLDDSYGPMSYNYFGKLGAESNSYESPCHASPWWELMMKNLIVKNQPQKLALQGLEEVAYDEFLGNLGGRKQMISVYPLRHPDLKETITLVLSTRTHKASKRYAPTVLGVLSRSSNEGQYRIWVFKEKDFCREVSAIMQTELNTEFEVLYKDHKNNNRYRLTKAV